MVYAYIDLTRIHLSPATSESSHNSLFLKHQINFSFTSIKAVFQFFLFIGFLFPLQTNRRRLIYVDHKRVVHGENRPVYKDVHDTVKE